MPAYLVLARKYRPSTFGDVIGQDHVTRTLVNSILTDRVAHAFLFCGVRGVGKTTVARILAKALNCRERGEEDASPCNKCTSCREITAGISMDVQEIDGASHTSVENIREINENIKYPPVSSPFKIIIIDEVHMISINAFNALLKTLEEPPAHAKFIFATTESHKVPATINSRCQKFNFRTISVRDIIQGMSRIVQQEGLQATEAALGLIAREAQGSFRDALSLLDQVIAFGSGFITEEEAASILGIAGRDCFGRLVRSILGRNPSAALGVVHELFQGGHDPEQFILDLIQYMRNIIVVRTVPRENRTEGMIDAPASEIDEMELLAGSASAEQLQNLFGILLRSESEVKRSGNPWIAFEMAVLRMSYAPEIVNLAEIIRRIDSVSHSIEWKPREALGGSSRRMNGHSTVESAGPLVRTKSGEDQAYDVGPAGNDAVSPEQCETSGLTEAPAGSLDEVWATLKDRITQSGLGPAIPTLMDHGNLISFGPTQVEIGFNKPIYREGFERGLETKPELRQVFEEVFGNARLKILTLTQETPLREENPYAPPRNGVTDLERALKNEAIDHPVVKAVLSEFEGSYIEDVKISPNKS